MTKIINSIEYKLIPIEGNQHYYISRKGLIYSFKYKRNLTHISNGKGYLKCAIIVNGIRKSFYVHRMIALAFIDNPHEKKFINHIDGIKINNYCENLEWVTHSENMKHAYEIGLKDNKGGKHPLSKLTECIVLKLRSQSIWAKLDYNSLSKKYNVSRSTISRAVNGKTFKHI